MPRLPNKKLIAAMLFVLLLLSLFTLLITAEKPDSAPNVSARSAVLYLPETKRFLCRKNASVPLPMASTTKIMTAIVAISKGDPDLPVTVAPEACGIEGSSLYLEPGETLTLRGLLYGLLLRSANDAACAIACAISGDEKNFVVEMNRKAEELGLSATHFDNPHGLDSDTHYTTAEDLAKIAAYGLTLPLFREICATEHIRIRNTDGLVRLVHNHNKLLRCYDGAIGVKTGYTRQSGRCLVSAAERDGVTLVCVTLDAPDDWSDHKNLLDFGFSSVERTELCEPFAYSFRVPILGGEKDYVTLASRDGLSVITDTAKAPITKRIEYPRYLPAPVEEGREYGAVVFYSGHQEIGRVPLFSTETVAKKKNFFEKLFGSSRQRESFSFMIKDIPWKKSDFRNSLPTQD